uniref:Lysine/arginine decarboxylase n=1 Tax=Flueggea suffruticosa TaxID=283120 RepID=A0AAU6W4Q5_9ROSI
MIIAFTSSLNFSVQLGFGNSRALKPLGSTRTRTESSVSQENDTLEPGKREGKSNKTLVSITNGGLQDGATPLVSALKAAAEKDAASFHFPGHNRGRAAPSSLTQLIGVRPFLHDLPELPELDNLFSPEGPILEAQKKAAKLFGAKETWFLVGGTTCGIQAAIMATCSPGDYIVLPRNSHMSAISGIVLSGAIPKYIIPQYDIDWDIAGGVSPSQVEKAITELQFDGRKPAAIFVTSPTYHGICSNLSEISQLCHSYGIPLIVDEAHGAHFGFHPQMPHSALQQGADLVVQSTHKVLCSLTQSSMLHMVGDIIDRERIFWCLQTLQSTSPSYLLLASLDAARSQISENPDSVFNQAMKLSSEAKACIKNIPGITVLDFSSFDKFPIIDPLRLTIGFWQLGLSGYEADDILEREYGIVSELVGSKSITFAMNLGTCREHVERLETGLKRLSACSFQNEQLENRTKKGYDYEPFSDFVMSMNPRDAFFSRKRRVSIEESIGKISGELVCPYPPGIPILIPGETITQNALDYLLDCRNKGAVVTGASDPLLSSLLICDV